MTTVAGHAAMRTGAYQQSQRGVRLVPQIDSVDAARHTEARQSSGVSSEATAIRQAAASLLEYGERSIALFGPKADAIAQIWALQRECAEKDWDGNNADPILETTAEATAEFIRALPDGLPLPEFAPEPDGAISLDWIQSRSRLLSLSIGTGSRIAYAWLDGAERGRAVAPFCRGTVPPSILDAIRRIACDGNATVGPR